MHYNPTHYQSYITQPHYPITSESYGYPYPAVIYSIPLKTTYKYKYIHQYYHTHLSHSYF